MEPQIIDSALGPYGFEGVESLTTNPIVFSKPEIKTLALSVYSLTLMCCFLTDGYSLLPKSCL